MNRLCRHAGAAALIAALGVTGAAMAQGAEGCEARLAALRAGLDTRGSMQALEHHALVTAIDQAAMFCEGGNAMLADRYIAALEEEISGKPAVPAGAAAELEAEAALSEADAGEPETAGTHDPGLGAARNDLYRFYGLYALPDEPQKKLFVAPADNGDPGDPLPEGYLMVGAMWGDGADWIMRSTGDTHFEHREPALPVAVNFFTGADGEATAMSIRSSFLSYDRLERAGDLPEAW